MPQNQQNTGYTFPGTASQNPELNKDSWLNVDNIKADDGSNATNALADDDSGDHISQQLIGTNYSFSIPSDAVVEGIQFRYQRFQDTGAGATQENQVQLRDENGNAVGNDKADGTNWASSPETEVKGGNSDLWGHSWNPADINNSNFGVILRAERGEANNSDAAIDYFQIRVFYTEPPDDPSGAAANQIDGDFIQITWTDNASDEDNYEIQRQVNGGGYSTLDATLAANTTSYTDTTVTGGNTYQYRVRALKTGYDPSGFSTSGSVTLFAYTGAGVPITY